MPTVDQANLILLKLTNLYLIIEIFYILKQELSEETVDTL